MAVKGSPAMIAGGMLIVIAAFYILREHWGHVVGAWPYLLLLLCPLMHVFMHRGHDGNGHGRR
jgi:Protein of unknown function (DUF2933)